MWAGPFISGAGHAAVIALAVWGLPWFSPREREAVRVTEVSFVTEAEFQAAMAAATSTPEAPPEPAAPPAAVDATPPPPMPEVFRGPSSAADVPPGALPDAAGEVDPEMAFEEPTLAPTFNPDAPLAMATPDFSPVTPRVVTVAPPTAVTPPQPRPVTRIAPDPAPAPQEPARPAPETTVAAAPEPEAEAVPEAPAETPAAPPEAAPEPVAEPSPPAELALMTSGRPMQRRGNVAPAPSAPAPAATPAPAAQPDRQQTIRDAVAAAGATPPTAPSVTQPTPPAASSLPVGPPISASERDGLKFAIQRCWNVPAGLRDANELRITVAAELDSDGAVISSSVRMIEPATILDGRYDAAWRAARTALLRCSPYSDLPREKFAQWRHIEVVFNPEGMVSW